MHRFTDPTPVTLRGQQVIRLFVESWEIECCATPPVVGQDSTWALRFYPTSTVTSTINALLSAERIWEVAHSRLGTELRDEAVTALWCDLDGARPAEGHVRLRGVLYGTVHGGHAPHGAPAVAGVVQRIQLVTVSGPPADRSLTLSDVARSPRWFARPTPIPAGRPPGNLPPGSLHCTPAHEDPTAARDVGVVLTLSLPRAQ